MKRAELIAKRQAVIDRIFPENKLGLHKFSAETGKCDQCSVKFTDWCIKQPDGSYRADMLLCGVIGEDEFARFGDPYNIRGDDGGY